MTYEAVLIIIGPAMTITTLATAHHWLRPCPAATFATNDALTEKPAAHPR